MALYLSWIRGTYLSIGLNWILYTSHDNGNNRLHTQDAQVLGWQKKCGFQNPLLSLQWQGFPLCFYFPSFFCALLATLGRFLPSLLPLRLRAGKPTLVRPERTILVRPVSPASRPLQKKAPALSRLRHRTHWATRPTVSCPGTAGKRGSGS